MLTISDNIRIMNKRIARATEEMDPKAIQGLTPKIKHPGARMNDRHKPGAFT